jgi:hypothetical protein
VVPAAKAKAVAAPVVTLKAVFEQLGETHVLPKKQAHLLLADFVTAMTSHLQTGARIRMSGLGILEVKSGGGTPGVKSGDAGKHSDQGEQEGGVSAGEGTRGRHLVT